MNFVINFLTAALLRFGYPIIFLGETLEGIGIPFPGETILLTASIYAGITHQLNIFLIILISTFGAYTGDNIGYEIGRLYGYNFLLKIGRPFKITEEHYQHAKYYFGKYGSLIVFIGRFTTFFRIFSPVLAGTNAMSRKKFMIYNFLGCIIWSALYGWIGFTFGSNVSLLNKIIKTLGLSGIISVVAVIVIPCGIYYYRKKRYAKKK